MIRKCDNMEFVTNIEKNEYEDFVVNSIKSHFMQSSYWGEFAYLEKKLIPHYVGIKKNDKLVCASLLLEKKLPLGYSYFYAPRGFVIDFNDFNLLDTFTKNIITYVKKKKGIFFKIDPDFIIHKYNYLDEALTLPYDYQKVFNHLISLGYKHKGFTKRFELTEPRFTFRIPFNQSFEDIEEHFSKTTKQRIKKAEKLGVTVEIASNVDDFYNLMKITENRKNFITYNKEYYAKLFEIFKGRCNIFLGSIHVDKIINDLNFELNTINNELNEFKSVENLSKSQNSKINELKKRKEKIENDIKEYQGNQNKYGNDIILSAHFIIEYGDKAWVLYAGNHDILSSTYTNYKTYLEHIRYYYNKGIKFYDQFGTVGKLEENDHLQGLHDFKKKFGGDYVEFIGEFDYITNKFMYFIFNKLVPIYRNIQFKKNAKKNS